MTKTKSMSISIMMVSVKVKFQASEEIAFFKDRIDTFHVLGLGEYNNYSRKQKT